MSRLYELIFIVKPDLGEEVGKAATEKLTGVVEESKGEVVTVEEWGKRKLAYPIEKCNEGNYVYLRFTAPPTAINEMERQLKLNEQVIRYLTVKIDPAKAAPVEEEPVEEEPVEETPESEQEPLAEEGGASNE